jgi:hypothetical protein
VAAVPNIGLFLCLLVITDEISGEDRKVTSNSI